LSPDRLLVATRSGGKMRELRSLLAPLGRTLVTLDDVGIVPGPEEDALEQFDTFEANALAKARYFARVSGLPTVADDSGLEVTALGGKPGVHSKRWSGSSAPDGPELEAVNRRKLLRELGDAADRRARFVCVAAYADGRLELIQRGETTGVILHRERGEGGFGYDPLFLSDDLGVTLAECGAEEKDRVSHRGRAFAALVARIVDAGC
jgi:XTP/dITP diphosphohydrolase